MWLTALILGFAGSMHCLGMCSPLLMAVTPVKRGVLLHRIIYNTGRILTYGIMGAVIASLGMLLPLHTYQNILSITMGIILLLIGIGTIKKISVPVLTSALGKISQLVKERFSRQLKNKTNGAMFVLGSLNGLLPCGLTLIALTWCLTLQGPLDGFNFMILFGAGTLPVMLGLTSLFPFAAKKLRVNVPQLTTSMLIFSGIALIARVFLIHSPHAVSKGGFVDIILCQ